MLAVVAVVRMTVIVIIIIMVVTVVVTMAIVFNVVLVSCCTKCFLPSNIHSVAQLLHMCRCTFFFPDLEYLPFARLDPILPLPGSSILLHPVSLSPLFL
jgi:hypothetical protein